MLNVPASRKGGRAERAMGITLIVTGSPGVGKSTVVSKVIMRLQSRGIIVGGCLTSERRVEGQRTGFDIKDLSTGNVGELASARASLGPKVGRYRVNLPGLASIGVHGLSAAAASSEVIVVDEVGPMELVSPDFRRALKSCIASGKPFLAVVHETMKDDIIEGLKSKADSLTEVTLQNRDSVPDELTSKLLESIARPKD
jgi:nucleoside-triphosphatase